MTLLYSLAGAEVRLGSRPQAESHLARALAIAQKRLPPDHPLIGRCLIDQAVLHAIQGHWNEATATADAARRREFLCEERCRYCPSRNNSNS